MIVVPNLEEVIETYKDLFAGRPDTFAILKEWVVLQDGKPVRKKAYLPSTHEKVAEVVSMLGGAEYTDDAIRAHLTGELFLGIYPLHSDSTIRVFALDFDGKNGDPWEAAKRQYEVFRDECGIETYLERSRSGEGYHLWGFLSEPAPALKVRHAIKAYTEKADTFDRMIPMQDEVDKDAPLGNLIALPLFGPLVRYNKSTFVTIGENGEPVDVPDSYEFMKSIKRIPVEVIYELFANAPEEYVEQNKKERTEDPEGLRGGFKVTHPIYGCEWVRWCYDFPTLVDEPTWYALACQFAQLDRGRELFHQWSARDKDRYDPKQTNSYFDRALENNKPHRCETLREQVKGPECRCDERFPDIVSHPYDLAKVPLKRLIAENENVDHRRVVVSALDGIEKAIEWAKRVEEDPEQHAGIKYGIEEFDSHTRLRPSDLILLCARPGIGKTMLGAVDIPVRLARSGVPVYIFSLEMSNEQLWHRLLARGAEVGHGAMSTGRLKPDEWRRIEEFKNEVRRERLPIFIDDSSRSMQSIFEMAGELMMEHGPGVVIIDYIQLVRGERGESQHDKVSRVSEEGKMMAKALYMPVIALTQLNRSAEEATEDAEPKDNWLKDSGSLEQNADVIWFMLGKKAPGIVRRRIWKSKDRHGESGIPLYMEMNQAIMKLGSPGTWSVRDSGLVVPQSEDEELAWDI